MREPPAGCPPSVAFGVLDNAGYLSAYHPSQGRGRRDYALLLRGKRVQTAAQMHHSSDSQFSPMATGSSPAPVTDRESQACAYSASASSRSLPASNSRSSSVSLADHPLGSVRATQASKFSALV